MNVILCWITYFSAISNDHIRELDAAMFLQIYIRRSTGSSLRSFDFLADLFEHLENNYMSQADYLEVEVKRLTLRNIR